MKKELTKEQKEQIFRLRKIRESLGYSQEQFASVLGISTSAYKKVESYERQISLTNLKKVHEELHVSTDYILFGEKVGVEDAWELVLNGTETDKFVIFLRLYHYFTKSKNAVFPSDAEQLKDLEKIFRFIDEIQGSEKSDDA